MRPGQISHRIRFLPQTHPPSVFLKLELFLFACLPIFSHLPNANIFISIIKTFTLPSMEPQPGVLVSIFYILIDPSWSVFVFQICCLCEKKTLYTLLSHCLVMMKTATSLPQCPRTVLSGDFPASGISPNWGNFRSDGCSCANTVTGNRHLRQMQGLRDSSEGGCFCLGCYKSRFNHWYCIWPLVPFKDVIPEHWWM